MRPPVGLQPMAAITGTRPPTGDGWAWELKWDGMRALGYVADGVVRLITRTGNDVTARYPELQPLTATLGDRDAVLDGEVVTFDVDGRPSFERLQQRMHVQDPNTIARLAIEVPVAYILFDVLWLDSASCMDEPYEQRRARLSELGLAGESWQTPSHELGDGATMLAVSHQFGIEGVLAKRVDSRYEPGRRSRSWVKIKHSLRQEFVVGGWHEGEGGRAGTIGSLLIGYYEGEGNARVLRDAGRVGSGLSHASIAALATEFNRTARATTPFADAVPHAGVHWVEPSVVVEVRFTEWTTAGHVRQPSFLGYRTDVVPESITREQ